MGQGLDDPETLRGSRIGVCSEETAGPVRPGGRCFVLPVAGAVAQLTHRRHRQGFLILKASGGELCHSPEYSQEASQLTWARF